MRKDIKQKLIGLWGFVAVVLASVLLFDDMAVQKWYFWEAFTGLVLLSSLYTARVLTKDPYSLTDDLDCEPITMVYNEPVLYYPVVDLRGLDHEENDGKRAKLKALPVLRHFFYLRVPEAVEACGNWEFCIRKNAVHREEIDILIDTAPPIPDDIQIRIQPAKEGAYPFTLEEWIGNRRPIGTPGKVHVEGHSIPQEAK